MFLHRRDGGLDTQHALRSGYAPNGGHDEYGLYNVHLFWFVAFVLILISLFVSILVLILI